MIGMQYNLQGNGVLLDSVVAGFGSLSSSEPKWKVEGVFPSNEPISVLDTRRSPSPSTSTSTLSSSLGAAGSGGSGSNEISGSFAAVSDNNPHLKSPVSLPPEIGFTGVIDSSAGGGGRKEEWKPELQQIPAALDVAGAERFGVGLEDWESLLSDSGQDQSLLRWISSEVDDGPFSLKQLLQNDTNPNEIGAIVEPASLTPAPSALSGSPSNDNRNVKIGPNPIPPITAINNPIDPQIPILGSLKGEFYRYETLDEKPQIINPLIFINQQQIPQVNPTQNFISPTLFPQQDPLSLLQPHPKRQNLGNFDSRPQIPDFDKHHPSPLGFAQQIQILPQQVVSDQLYKASELTLAGNLSHAQWILARLNHQLSHVTKPFQRAAFYFKEALQSPHVVPSSASPLLCKTPPTPIDGVLKMGAYKLLSEISPIIQFINFTSNQALLEVIGEAEQVHVIDFDIGCGAQWASFMAELPNGSKARYTPSLKITAFASPSTHHPFELGLMHENLTRFANEIGISFELEVVNFDAFDPSSYPIPLSKSSDKEVIAVNFPIWACSKRLSVLPSLLRFIKQLSPKIMVSTERGCERTDLPFSHHLLHALQYYEALLDSFDASNANSETVNKIEKLIIQPKIENIVSGRLSYPDQMPHWKALLAAAGFCQVPLSNFAETQAECVLKKTQVRGFHVEKRQASLVLSWQHRELVSASAWRC